MKKDKLSKSQKLTLKVGIILGVVTFIYGALLIMDDYQRYQRDKTITNPVTLNEDIHDIPAFDVEGLSEEEIEEMIELYRQQMLELYRKQTQE